jgi:hypothetical protein
MQTVATGQVQVRVMRRVEFGGGRGYRWEPTGEYRTVQVRVRIDGEAILHQLGMRAATNKRGRARFMKGAVLAEVTK